MTLSPDGRSIVYDFPPNEELGQRDIYMLATNGSREVSIVEHGANDSNPIWTPAGDAILFTSDRTGSLGLWRQPMREEGRDGAPTLVKPNVGAIIPMGFTPEGALYYGLEVGQNDVYMATLTVTADDYLSPPMPIIETYMGHNTVPDFSPDGEYLSYISQRGQATRGPQAKVLVIRSLSTGEEHELQTELNISTQIAVPRWSPDSRSLVTLGQGRDGRFDFYQIDAETGAHKMLVDSPGDGGMQRMPILLPGGKSLIHERKLTYDDLDMGLIIQDLETGDERTLFLARHLHAWTLSPDGQQVAVSVSAEGPQEEVELAEGRTISLPEGGFLLLVLPVDGSEATEIIRTPQREEVTGLAWTADSRYVFYIQQTILSQLEDRADDESAPVWRIPASGGEPMLTELRFRPDEILSLRPHPDGRRLVYTSGHSEAQPKREIWVQENFLPR
jgi:Tol biopolymer transport system component